MTNLSNYILEKLDTLVVVINPNGEIAYINQSVKKLLGYEPIKLIGLSWSTKVKNREALSYDIKKSTLSLLRQKKEQLPLSSFASEQVIVDAFGIEKYILWNLSLGPENELIGIGQDISEIKRNENQLVLNNRKLKEKNNEVLDSIAYSQRIQKAILPDQERIRSLFSEAFVLYKPKDIVSGDFYWVHEQNGKIFVAGIDCTGHGVPGALMTVLANSLLRNIVRQNLEDPAEILQKLDEYLFEELNNNGSEQTPDGMDIALCVIDRETKKLTYSGAFRSLVLIRDGEFIEFKGARYPIGFYKDIEKEFISTEVDVQENDAFYVFSDGFVDQFGGEEVERGGKKFNKKNFRKLLLEVQSFSLEEQEGYLEYVFRNWKQHLPQTDDVLVMGFRV
ncbi:MAG: domain S-box [Crocinitomicaceae bacterium]|jgi:PAS domain S-box-containing protein|nr:domain S-box [Crocinitomicaceae bacterium]